MPKPQYGAAHQKLRAQWKKRIEAGEEVHCHHRPACTRPEDTLIHPGEPFDLEHDPITKETTGPGHRTCNRGTSRQWKEIALGTAPAYSWFDN